MDFGIRVQEIERVVRLLEAHLGIKMNKTYSDYFGAHWHWVRDVDARGFGYHGVDVRGTLDWDPDDPDPRKIEESAEYSRAHWEGYGTVIVVDDVLTEQIAGIRKMITSGILLADELIERRIHAWRSEEP